MKADPDKIAELLGEQEQDVLQKSVDLWNSFIKLYQSLTLTNPLADDDINDFRNAVHTCQRIIMARAFK